MGCLSPFAQSKGKGLSPFAPRKVIEGLLTDGAVNDNFRLSLCRKVGEGLLAVGSGWR